MPLSHPGTYLINKGFTLEVMGEHERAIEVLLEAESLPELRGRSAAVEYPPPEPCQ